MRDLTMWALRNDPQNPYRAPESSRLYLEGVCEGKPITTSHIVDVVEPRVCLTRSGSLYRLVGDPDPAYAEFCAKNGITLDLNDPVKKKPSSAARA